MDKAQLRQIIRERKQQYSRQELENMSIAVIERMMAHQRVKNADTIMLYYALPDEVDTHQCIETMYQAGKKVLLPKVIGDGLMEIRKYEGKATLRQGTYNIMEPVGGLYTDYPDIDIVIVPGISFDREGNRLGRGKGYYDRFLSQTPGLYKLGVCFDFQKVERVPCSSTDVKMDEVL